LPDFSYFPDEIAVTGTPKQLDALLAIPGYFVQEHGQLDNDDGTVTVVGYSAQTDTSGVVAKIQALGLQPSVTTAADRKARMQPPPGPDPDDGGGVG
jgi:hypothetical protein